MVIDSLYKELACNKLNGARKIKWKSAFNWIKWTFCADGFKHFPFSLALFATARKHINSFVINGGIGSCHSDCNHLCVRVYSCRRLIERRSWRNYHLWYDFTTTTLFEVNKWKLYGQIKRYHFQSNVICSLTRSLALWSVGIRQSNSNTPIVSVLHRVCDHRHHHFIH